MALAVFRVRFLLSWVVGEASRVDLRRLSSFSIAALGLVRPFGDFVCAWLIKLASILLFRNLSSDLELIGDVTLFSR